MKKLNITLSTLTKDYWINDDHRFAMKPLEKFISYFFDDINVFIHDSDVEHLEMDGVIYCIQDDETFSKKLNIMLCVENCMYFHHYKHFNKYNSYDNLDIKIFLYGFIDKIETNINNNKSSISLSKRKQPYIAIPIIYPQMNYFQKQYNKIEPSEYTKYENKKFCLIATTLNSYHKYNIYEMLQSVAAQRKLGQCDLIENFRDSIGKKSIYHNTELLNLFNQYLFVFVCENCVTNGYVTEKIFNCYFARTVPIYYGSENITRYFNKDTFINIFPCDDNPDLSKTYNTIIDVLDKKEIYDSYIKKDVTDIISKNHDDENYKEQLNLFISNATSTVDS